MNTGSSSEPPTEWPTDASQYELIGKIGQGAFASVWRACTRTTTIGRIPTTAIPPPTQEGQNDHDDHPERYECAIKVLNLDHVDSNLSEIRLEVQAMRLSSHPNILACHTAFVVATDLWLVTQLMRKGSSLHCLQDARRRLRQEQRLQQQQQQQQQNCTNADTPTIKMEDHIMYIMHETLLGLQYIHENGQIHRDIKAGNILLDSNGDVRIADFGVSGWLVNAGTQQEKAKTFVGTPCWMAPEVMEQIHGYDYKADIWSLGITALELAKGYAPYAKFPPMKVLILTIQEDPPSLDTYDEEEGVDDDDDLLDVCDEEFTKSFRSFVDACLQKNPTKRPKCTDMLQFKPLIAFQDPVYRENRRVAIAREVCDLVDDVGNPDISGTGGGQSNSRSALPSNTPVSIVLSQEDNNRQAGTTWVFADGSQVVSSSARSTATVDDVMDEIDQFGLQTGGEHYSRGQVQVQTRARTETAGSHNNDEPDDLNAFMDEFELNTQGENFRHPSN